MPLELAPLPYSVDALEPHIDAMTMTIHHSKHHAAYVTNANKALEGTPFSALSGLELIKRLAEIPDAKRNAVRNNAGGHVNHTMFWEIMASPSAGGGGKPVGPLAEAIVASFGSFEAFQEKFLAAATGRFGSGWVWLVVRNRGLEIVSTANQDNPLMGDAVAGCSGQPILGLDVWEHAYYLKYQNLRASFVGAWWNVVNWNKVGQLYAAAL